MIKEAFIQVVYKHKVIKGKPLLVDASFIPNLQRVCEYAEQCNLELFVTSSLRDLKNKITGAIVPPATNSCHHIGHGFDFNIIYSGVFYNSTKLKKSNYKDLPVDIQKFFSLIREDENLRWGGDFTPEDPIHIDDDYYHKNKQSYVRKLNSRIAQEATNKSKV